MADQGRLARAPEPPDLARLCRALNDVGAAADVDDLDVRTYTVVRVIDEIIIDLLGKTCGLAYTDVVADAEIREILGVAIPIASPATLIRTKDTHRPQDAIDRAFLTALIRTD